MPASCCRAFLLLFVLLSALGAEDAHVPLAIGSPAPDFALPGVDGQTHKLSDYAGSPILAIVFTCNHCPTAQLYEGRIKRIAADYRDKGVALDSFMSEAPFAGRFPIFIGDDQTDRAAFEAVIRVHGMAIAVGPRVTAPWWLPDPAAVRGWLRGCLGLDH